jgi:hypothetical protein
MNRNVLNLFVTATVHDVIAESNGWQDNEQTAALAREHYVIRNGSTGAEITEYEQLVAKYRAKRK